MKYDDVLCEVNADTYSEVPGDCETEILDSDIDVPTTDSLRKWQSFPFLLVRLKQVQ
jgi:hypothetical protein